MEILGLEIWSGDVEKRHALNIAIFESGVNIVTLQTNGVNSVGNIFIGLSANQNPVTTIACGPRSGSLFRGWSHRASGLDRDHQTRCHRQEQHGAA